MGGIVMCRIITAMFFSLVGVMPLYASSVDKHLYIYADEGAGEKGVLHLEKAFRTLLPEVKVKTLNADDVLKGEWVDHALAFVMPGGADLPYVKKLNGEGNKIIRSYVEAGGTYIGICAGAYYGSSFCDFHRGDDRGYEVLGARELSFFKGAAIGPVLAPYVYNSEVGARVAKLIDTRNGDLYTAYYNGGCYFEGDEAAKVLFVYKNEEAFDKPAIIECAIGKGKSILSGVHPEYPIEGHFDPTLFQHLFACLARDKAGRSV
jgi:glutamine amidotransferase-like uncharacterized protein